MPYRLGKKQSMLCCLLPTERRFTHNISLSCLTTRTCSPTAELLKPEARCLGAWLQLNQEGDPDSAADVAAAVAGRGRLTALLRTCMYLLHNGQILAVVNLAVALVRCISNLLYHIHPDITVSTTTGRAFGVFEPMTWCIILTNEGLLVLGSAEIQCRKSKIQRVKPPKNRPAECLVMRLDIASSLTNRTLKFSREF